MSKKIISKPEHWQDFETLCKKLWGEIWQIPTKVKKNGRSGQQQAGVDVYGVPKGEEKYWGIQCKGKSKPKSSLFSSHNSLLKSSFEYRILFSIDELELNILFIVYVYPKVIIFR